MIANEPTKTQTDANSRRDAQYVIQVDWPDGLKSDVDIWVMSPTSDMVSYMRKNVDMMHLERDDRGELDDYTIVDGERIQDTKNQEIIVLRGIVQGRYLANLYLYTKKDDIPEIPVTVKLIKLNPKYEEVMAKTITLRSTSQEETAFEFILNPDGSILTKDMNDHEKFIQKHIVKEALNPPPAPGTTSQ